MKWLLYVVINVCHENSGYVRGWNYHVSAHLIQLYSKFLKAKCLYYVIMLLGKYRFTLFYE